MAEAILNTWDAALRLAVWRRRRGEFRIMQLCTVSLKNPQVCNEITWDTQALHAPWLPWFPGSFHCFPPYCSKTPWRRSTSLKELALPSPLHSTEGNFLSAVVRPLIHSHSPSSVVVCCVIDSIELASHIFHTGALLNIESTTPSLIGDWRALCPIYWRTRTFHCVIHMNGYLKVECRIRVETYSWSQ